MGPPSIIFTILAKTVLDPYFGIHNDVKLVVCSYGYGFDGCGELQLITVVFLWLEVSARISRVLRKLGYNPHGGGYTTTIRSDYTTGLWKYNTEVKLRTSILLFWWRPDEFGDFPPMCCFARIMCSRDHPSWRVTPAMCNVAYAIARMECDPSL